MRLHARKFALAFVPMLAASAMFVAGCGTWKGFGRDVSNLGGKIEGKNETTATGLQGQQLTITTPRSVTFRRGQTQTFEIEILRRNFTGGVDVTLSTMPRGVTAEGPSNPVTGDVAAYVLKAGDAADMVRDQPVVVTVTGPGGVQASRTFELTVKE